MTKAALLTRLAERLDPRHAALLVIDMQNDFCAAGGYIETVLGLDAAPCRAVVAPIMGLVGAARSARLPVVWIKADYRPELVPPPMTARLIERGADAPCCVPGTWGADYFGVAPAAGEPVFEKHCFSALHESGLEAWLRARGIRTVVLTGVQTNVCIDSTMRDAASRGFYIVIPRDCVASHTPPLHEATLKTAAAVFGDVLDSAAIHDLWRAAPSRRAIAT